MKHYNNNCILVFGDTHFPYCCSGAISFLDAVRREWSPDRVVHLGDILDIYSVSDYPKDISHEDTWTEELKKGREFVGELAEIFPKLDVLSSNHDDRAYKKSRVSGIPREFLVPYLDVIGAPEGWKLHDRLHLTVDSDRSKWLFAHTLSGGAFQSAKNLGMSVCLGHSHSKFGATAFNTGRKLLWGVDAGCLISDKGSPFKYNRGDIGRPIRGCCIIHKGSPINISLE